MKKLFLLKMIYLLLQIPVFCYALEMEEILNDIRNLPVEKIIFKKYEKLKAIQIFVLPKTIEELEIQMKTWKEIGVNTLILRVFHNEKDRYHFYLSSDIKKGVYFKTNKAPVVFDALEYFLPVAKKYGFKVFAWMTTRYADFENYGFEKVVAYSPYEKNYYYSKGLNILSKNVQEYIASLFMDLATYPIDGILLQDDLFLRYNESFDHITKLQFQRETNIEANPENMFIVTGNNNIKYSESFWEWRKWKSKEIARFVDFLNKKVKRINPDIKIAVNLTYESITHPKGALAWLGHDIQQLKEVSDYLSLMAYHRQIMDELKISLEDSYYYLKNMVEKCIEEFPNEPERILFKVQIKDWKTNQSIEQKEIEKLFKNMKKIGKLSIAIVPYPPEIPADVVKSIFIENSNNM